MNLSINKKLKDISAISFALFFVFNFIDRSIGNIFLLTTLILCLVNYKFLYESIKLNINLFICVILFSSYIALSAIYHESPLNELDNYYRFLLLLPLLAITFNERYITVIISICAMITLLFALYNNAFFTIINYSESFTPTRYTGSSSVSITYGNMCATLFLIALYYIFYKGNRSWYLIFSAIVFLTVFILTATRGPVIGIMLGLIYLSFILIKDTKNIKSNYFFGTVSVLILLLAAVPNPLFDRFKNMAQIDFYEISNNEHASIRERIYLLGFGIEKIKSNFIEGVGAQNISKLIKKSIDKEGINNVTAYDHLHNDFLDIVLKFGFISLVLLLFIYFYLIHSKNSESRTLILLVLIMLVSTQMTQSHFAHHQAITFYISLLYLLQNKVHNK